MLLTASAATTTSYVPKLYGEMMYPVLDRLGALEPLMRQLLPTKSTQAHAAIDHLFQAGGKRIRPALFFMCCDLVGYRGEHMLTMGAVCEFVHGASLLHDDVVDNSPLRRGRPTANTLWGDVAAVLVGDLMYARASELMAATQKIPIVESFAESIRSMSEGELIQLEALYNLEKSKEVYFDIIGKKTAHLLGSICRSAAILAEHPGAQALQRVGFNVGLSFQLVDDALDYAATESALGKPSKTDLSEGKLTYPIMSLLEEVAVSTKTRWLNLISKKRISQDLIEEIKEAVREFKIIEKTMDKSKHYSNLAVQILRDHFPDSETQNTLIELINKLTKRTV